MYMYIYVINSTTIHLRFSYVSILTNLESKNHLKDTVKALE